MMVDILHWTLWFIAFSLIVIVIVSLYNLFAFARVKRVLDTNHQLPFVSILIPARNEERGIRECIESVCNQIYPAYEVIVLDDDSTDSTPQILREIQAAYPEKLTIIKGETLPDDWIGKSHACQQLSAKARGEYLLFTDADTIHSPYSLISLIQASRQYQADLLTAVPDQQLHSFWEHLMVPFMHLLYHGYLPNTLIHTNSDPRFTAANGQIMLFLHEAYDEIGGHESVKTSLVEDIDIAKKIKEHKRRVVLSNAKDIVSCSMYNGFDEVFKGFSKNFFSGFSENTFLFIVFIFHIFSAYVFPPILLIIGLILNESDYLIWGIVLTILGMIIRLSSTIQFSLPLYHVLLQPLSTLFAIVIACNSYLWSLPHRGIKWKGRVYTQ
jgi:chlorobactene glucosyltransferase